MKKIILFELNEVPVKIFEFFLKNNPNSTFAKIRQKLKKFETLTADIGALSPWVTWPTVHRGVSNDKHYISDFGENLYEKDKEFPPVWKILARNGVPVGLFGSLHSYPLPVDLNNYKFFIPDTFAAGAECFPQSVEVFQDFNLRMVKESGRNVSAKLPWADVIKLMAHLPALGLKPRTLLDVSAQIIEERACRWKVVRRRTYQSVLAFDVFFKQLAKTRPGFASFFTNQVASTMHRYWAAAFPTEYESIDFSDQWIGTYQGEINFTMNKVDQMIGKLVKFIDQNDDYCLWIVSSMGQQATMAKSVETQLYVTDREKLMDNLHVPKSERNYQPCMLPSFNVQVGEGIRGLLRKKLNNFTVNGFQIGVREKSEGLFSIDFGHANLKDEETIIRINGKEASLSEVGLKNVEIQEKSGTTAYHIPQGSMYIYQPNYQSKSETVTQISVLDIAPSILQNYAVDVPAYMNRPAIFG